MKGKKKIVSLVLMFLCIIFMFGNWIAFRNTKEKDEYIATWKLGAGASTGLSDLANMFGAQDARTSDSLKNASKAFNQMSKAVDDGKFTPVEIISMGSGLKAYKTVYGDYLDESASRSITIIQVMDVVYMLLFWAVIILLIFNIWNHLQDKSMRNTETIQLIFACAMFLFTLVIKAGMNNAFTEGSGARVLRLTIIPYLFVIFTAVGKVLWNQGVTAKEEPVIKTTVAVKADIPAAGAANRTAETGSQTVCPTCGAVISAEAQFCRKCGAKIEKPSVQPAAQSLKCPFCGAELKADDVFCQSC